MRTHDFTDPELPANLKRELVVRAGNNYGAATAGDHVIVDEREAQLMTRLDREGRPLGALRAIDDPEIHVDDWGSIVPPEKPAAEPPRQTLKERVDAGLLRITAAAEVRAKAKREAALRADLERLRLHQALERAAVLTPAEREEQDE